MKIFNTLTRQKDDFKPITEGEVKIYACGPTVYNYIHIGNARPLCVFDVLRRYFEWRGFKVNFVQNFTDIDDKLINKANAEGITVPEVAERFIGEFWTDAKGLNVREATVHPRATDNIAEIQGIITALIEKGYAYAVGGDVYYRAKKFGEYGKLSHQPLDELAEGASNRVDGGADIKEDPMDFCLWKGAKEGEPFWESPWGKGRPGWHIECSAMAGRYLGKTIDIHCGGLDLISHTMKMKLLSRKQLMVAILRIIGCITALSMLTIIRCQNHLTISLLYVMLQRNLVMSLFVISSFPRSTEVL